MSLWNCQKKLQHQMFLHFILQLQHDDIAITIKKKLPLLPRTLASALNFLFCLVLFCYKFHEIKNFCKNMQFIIKRVTTIVEEIYFLSRLKQMIIIM